MIEKSILSGSFTHTLPPFYMTAIYDETKTLFLSSGMKHGLQHVSCSKACWFSDTIP